MRTLVDHLKSYLAWRRAAQRSAILWPHADSALTRFNLAYARYFGEDKGSFNPDQPRVPAGSPDGGQWTSGGGGDAGKDPGDRSDANLVSEPAAMRGPRDKRPLPLHVPLGSAVHPETGRQRVTIINNAQTGLSNVDETTEKLRSTLEDVVNRLPSGSGSSYGTRIHTDFANAVREQNLRGIGRAGVEQTFPRDQPYGSPDSIRTDIILRDDGGDKIAIYDVKTGGARLTARRVQELLAKAEANPKIPVIEMHVIHGLSLKAQTVGLSDNWIILLRVWAPDLPDIEDLVEG